ARPSTEGGQPPPAERWSTSPGDGARPPAPRSPLKPGAPFADGSSMIPELRPLLIHCAASILAASLAQVGTELLAARLGLQLPLMPSLVAIVACAWPGRLWPGILCTGLCTIAL